jgi:hypothetical protein
VARRAEPRRVVAFGTASGPAGAVGRADGTGSGGSPDPDDRRTVKAS